MESSRAEKIAESIEELVFKGEYGDGERLDEITLAENFNVSRTPIREALQRLVLSGMAEQIPRRGVFIRQPDAPKLFEMFEAMAELEAACGRYAATRMSEEALERLREANQKCQDAIEAQDVAEYYLQNEKFHQTIYEGSANSYLQKEALKLQNRLKPYRRAQLRFRGRMKQSMDEHLAIVDALDKGDGELAANVLRGHVSVQGERFHQLIATLGETKQK